MISFTEKKRRKRMEIFRGKNERRENSIEKRNWKEKGFINSKRKETVFRKRRELFHRK